MSDEPKTKNSLLPPQAGHSSLPLERLARDAAGKHGLDPSLVCAVCEQESAWNPWAIRFEWGFLKRYLAEIVNGEPQSKIGKFGLTELFSRSFSWGLMQVIGHTARREGQFLGRFLSELCSPAVGLEVGCRVLRAYLKEKGGDVRSGLLRWNGGGRPAYADEVLARMNQYRLGA